MTESIAGLVNRPVLISTSLKWWLKRVANSTIGREHQNRQSNHTTAVHSYFPFHFASMHVDISPAHNYKLMLRIKIFDAYKRCNAEYQQSLTVYCRVDKHAVRTVPTMNVKDIRTRGIVSDGPSLPSVGRR